MTKRIIASLLCVVIVLAAVPAIFANAESTTSTVSLSDLAAQIAALGSQISSIMGSLRNIQTQTQGNGSQNGQPLIGDPNFAISGIRPLTPGNPGGVISPKGNLFTGKITAISGNTLTLQTNGFQKLTAAATNTANSATVDDRLAAGVSADQRGHGREQQRGKFGNAHCDRDQYLYGSHRQYRFHAGIWQRIRRC